MKRFIVGLALFLATGANAGEITIRLSIDGQPPATVAIYMSEIVDGQPPSIPVEVDPAGISISGNDQQIVIQATTKKSLQGAISNLRAVAEVAP